MSRLADATSEYLRLHAANPVDWWPWGDDAFAEARRRDVPVLVSVGYATCHWCHVMARESFSDPEVAAAMLDGFVSIKVDREELPEVDDALMSAASAFTRQLGWPLTVVLTPDGLPFFAGTYYPRRRVSGVPGILEVLAAVREAWRDRRDQAVDTGRRVQQALASPPDAADPEPAALRGALARIGDDEDRDHGGLGTAQRFPHLTAVLALLDAEVDVELAGRLVDAAAGDDGIVAAGGFSRLRGRDGGWFRYATRPDWTEPHFERMLVDNAQALHAATLLGRETVARGLVAFLDDVLRQPGGAFAVAEDAESTVDGARVEGGWHLAPGRERPPLDRLVVTAANGLAVEALALRALRDGDERALGLARGAAEWLLAEHVLPEGLVHASLDGVASTAPATAADAGSLARGLLALAAATGEVRWAIAAAAIVDAADDPARATAGGPALRLGPPSDGVQPSGQAALARALTTLHALTADERFAERARSILDPAAALRLPVAGATTLAVGLRMAEPPRTLVLVGDAPLAHRRRPDALLVQPDQVDAWVDAGFMLLDGKREPGAYACAGFVCRLPERFTSAQS